MTTVLTIAQQKGGAGKTTLAAHLAVAYIAQQKRVALIDIDPQGSLARWYQARCQNHKSPQVKGELDMNAIGGWRLSTELTRLKREHDVVLIDSPPHAETEARVAVRLADLVLIPMQPSPMDLWATGATVDLARAAGVPLLIVLNRVQARSALVDQMRRRLAEQRLAVARASITNRLTFAATMLEGRTVMERAPRSVAAAEVRTLIDEIAGRLPRAADAPNGSGVSML